MIQLFGDQQSREYEAAQSIRDAILAVWPSIAVDPAHDVRLIAGAKCHGQRRRDIDILLMAQFGEGPTYPTFLAFQGPDLHYHKPQQVHVQSLCIAIEVKDHSPDAVRFTGTDAEVRYNGGWHNASSQNEDQVFSVKRYLEYHGIRPPWVDSLLWLRNVPATELPDRPHPVIGAQMTWELILNILGQLHPPRWRNDRWVVSATDYDHNALDRATDLFTKTIQPTRLDRLRMERLSQANLDIAAIRGAIGQKLVVLRGRGGTGKTLGLLQCAKYLYEEQGARILLLTYNRALVADIRRLLAIMGIGNTSGTRAIHIQTVHSFLYAALKGLGALTHDLATFLERYEPLKEEALEFLRSGAISTDDIETLVRFDSDAFRWDYIFIDEGQDWPHNERDLIMHLYGHAQMVVADGVEQLVRSTKAADWRGALQKSSVQVTNLKRCLRMKAGLVRFVTSVANHLKLPALNLEASDSLPGGRVIVVEGSYFTDRTLHDELVADNHRDENSPIDMLFCTSSSLVRYTTNTSEASSIASDVFRQWGYATWDGVSEMVRDGYPTELDQLRIVQYESCRGLEGWIVVCLGLDDFYSTRLQVANGRSAASRSDTGTPSTVSSLVSPEHIAARWLLIPLTRAMDTLVIQIDDPTSPVYAALVAASKEYPDIVQWRRVT